jgi:nucleoside-diphosphate-sugar epimerase
VLVTGADGFIGRALGPALEASGYQVRAAVRTAGSAPGEAVVVGDIGPATDWREALRGADAVIHLAARVHVMRERASDPLAAFRHTNVEGTAQLARAAAAAGVRRLVYVSSVKVNGERTTVRPFTEADPPAPEDDYGRSKWEAESVTRQVASGTGLELVVVRPCLVYGPGVKGNLRALLAALARGVPLPLGSVRNRRSLVGLDNLCGLLVRCVEQAAAAGESFLAADGEDLSTPEMVRALATGIGRPARLFPVPVPLLEAAGALAGRREAVERLTGSLQLDAGKARRVLGWVPTVGTVAGLQRTGAWYRGARL